MPTLDQFIGQTSIKSLLRPKIKLATASGMPLPHLLLCGEKEQGKMTLAAAIAEQLKGKFRSSSSATLVKSGDLSEILANLEYGDVFAVSEVEAIRPPVFVPLIEAISHRKLEITIGVGPSARKHSLDIRNFTFIGTTSKPWMVDERLRRWCISCQFASYTREEATQIVLQIAQRQGLTLDADAASDIAVQCKLRPGEVTVFLQRVASHFPLSQSDRLDRARLREVNEFLGAGKVYPDLLRVADQIQSMSGTEFEHWVADLFRSAGFQVEVTQTSGDHGVDLWVSSKDGMIAVQCKRWDGAVGEPVVRDLYGVTVAANARVGCLVTTGTFTAQAQQFSKDKPLCLIGFDSLMEAVRSAAFLPEILFRR